jgi:hypothetical protein
MKLRPIMRTDLHAAVSLLTEGFRLHSREFWNASVVELLSYTEKRWDGIIGHIASANGQEIGICLSIPGMRTAYEAVPHKVINLAALYMRPGNEWLTTLFMRRLMKDPDVEYLDVTASETMRNVLRQLGFADRATGMVIVPTAVAAMHPGRTTRILPRAQLTPDMMSPGHLDLLDQHARRQAISLGVDVGGKVHPLILVPTSRKRLAGGRIILARDRELIRSSSGALARHLLKLGLFFFEFDSPSPVPILGSRFVRKGAPVQTTWPVEVSSIDHTYSELLFIPALQRQPLFALRRQGGNPKVPLTPGLLDASITAAPSTTLALSLVEMLPV